MHVGSSRGERTRAIDAKHRNSLSAQTYNGAADRPLLRFTQVKLWLLGVVPRVVVMGLFVRMLQGRSVSI